MFSGSWLKLILTSKFSGADVNNPNYLSVFFQDEKDDDMCEEEDLDGQNNSANRKRHMWWESRQGTDEKNVRQS